MTKIAAAVCIHCECDFERSYKTRRPVKCLPCDDKRRGRSLRQCRGCKTAVGSRRHFCDACRLRQTARRSKRKRDRRARKATCSKCGDLFRPHRRTIAVCFSCAPAAFGRRRFKNMEMALRRAVVRNGRAPSAERFLGYTVSELRAHLEAQFAAGMTWAVFASGAIHIDHKRPVALFDLDDEAQVRECWALSNLQPLWAGDNMRKGARYGEGCEEAETIESPDLAPAFLEGHGGTVRLHGASASPA